MRYILLGVAVIVFDIMVTTASFFYSFHPGFLLPSLITAAFLYKMSRAPESTGTERERILGGCFLLVNVSLIIPIILGICWFYYKDILSGEISLHQRINLGLIVVYLLLIWQHGDRDNSNYHIDEGSDHEKYPS